MDFPITVDMSDPRRIDQWAGHPDLIEWITDHGLRADMVPRRGLAVDGQEIVAEVFLLDDMGHRFCLPDTERRATQTVRVPLHRPLVISRSS